ncbi:phosphatidylglycerophosphatase A [Pelagibius sp.]|uniref:phosphatidylglycerophosphatase A family protein n=1 Tax=Pelagibius sp. TaxID=1931238 RepID=UPI00261F01D0|nr:phosphatidylglycerophosphatase A [Pelagibius sp.]
MAALSPWHPAALIATWFGSGLLPAAPGTWGSLAALPVGLLVVWAGGPLALLLAAAALLLLGLWASARYEAAAQRKDPGEIVVDEVVGQWLALVPAGLAPLGILLAFCFFRLFDVAKPWPVSWADRALPGAWGIMLDDVFAGLYAALFTYGALWLWGSL